MAAGVARKPEGRELPGFAAPYAPPDEAIAAGFLAQAARAADADARIEPAPRGWSRRSGRRPAASAASRISCANSLSTREGLALMVLAEALLRVPDAATADRLIEDKLAAGDWAHHEAKSNALLVSASAWALGISAASCSRARRRKASSNARQAARPAGRAHRHAPGDAHARLALRARPDHRGSARPRRRAARVPPFLRHARRGRPHRGRRGALFRQLRARDRRDRQATAGNAPLPERPAFRSSSRRCIRVTRRSRASACCRSWCRAAGARAQGEAARPQFHRRCRGGRPARTVARCDRRGAARSFARRLGRLRACGPGLSEARRRRGRLGARRRGRARPAADGASGQGRLLGHRSEARAGARACRLSGVHPQGHHRPLLSGVRDATARRAAGALPAIRHPQCADRRERDRGGGRRRRLRVPAPARHGRGALRGADRRRARARAASTRRSAGIAICSPIWCGACWRTAPTRRSCRSRPIRRCRSQRSCAARRHGSRTRATRAIRASRCRAICTRRSGRIGRRGVRRPREPAGAARRRAERRAAAAGQGRDRRRTALAGAGEADLPPGTPAGRGTRGRARAPRRS